MWVIVSACFVFFMQAGFICYEVGVVQTKNVVSVAIENILTFVVATLVFWLWGFGLMFGQTVHGLWGNGYWLLSNLGQSSNPLQYAYVFFQLMFVGTSVTIFSGSMSERTKLIGLVLAAVVMAGFIYPLYGHWVWGGKYAIQQVFLSRYGFVDFAGATVVHASAGWMALAGIIVVGPRRGRFDKNGKIQKMGGSNIPFAVLGTFILWFSWFGFNGGSLLRFDPQVGLILLNTNFSAAAGVVGALLTSRLFFRDKSYIEAILSGALGGLVAITAGSNLLTPTTSTIVGFSAGVVVVLSSRLLERLSLDDAVGACPIHAFGGVTGTILLALLVPADQLPTGSHLIQLAVQVVGVLINFVWAFALGLALFYLLKKTIGLRVTPEEEAKGLNIVEFGDIYSWADFIKTRHYQNILYRQNIKLRKQTRLLMSTQEQERLKVGRDLHDGVGQSLAAIKFQLGMLKNRLPSETPENLEQGAARTLDLVDSAIEEMRTVLLNLRPTILRDQGLQNTVRYMVKSIQETTGLNIRLTFVGDMPVWDEAVDLNIYRIVQEGLANVIKHAHASNIDMSFSRASSDLYVIKIADDGKGFVFGSTSSGIGLMSIEERSSMLGGKVEIQSVPESGTTLILEVPIGKNTPSNR